MPKVSPLSDRDLVLRALEQSKGRMTHFLRALGLGPVGGNHAAGKKWLEIHNLRLSDYWEDIPRDRFTRIPDDEVYVENSTYKIRRRYLHRRSDTMYCDRCSLGAIWQGEELVLQVDHINGVNSDNRLSNLRLLCPNCHAQTETFCGGNSPLKKDPSQKKPKRVPCICGGTKDPQSALCLECHLRVRYKTQWPSDEDLLSRAETESLSSIGRSLGVDGNSVKKRLKKIQSNNVR